MPKHLTEEQKLSIRKKRNSEDRHVDAYQNAYQRELSRLKRAGVTSITLSQWRRALKPSEERDISELDADIQRSREKRTAIILAVADRAKDSR